MRFVVTGANGYIGSELVKQLADAQIEVLAIDINNTQIDKRADYKQIDIFDEFPLGVVKNIDILIHLAWRNGFNHNHPSHLEDLHKHFQFIQHVIDSGCSNISVLGTMHEVGYYEGKLNEDAPCNPMSLYGVSKNALRQSIECYTKDKDVCVHWLRAFYITGNDLNSNSVFGKLLRSALNGQKEFPFTSGKNQYDFISVDELCRQIIAASMQTKIDGIINLCSGVPMSLGDRMNQFIAENNLDIKLKYGVFPDRPYDSPIIYGDNSKIKAILEKKSYF